MTPHFAGAVDLAPLKDRRPDPIAAEFFRAASRRVLNGADVDGLRALGEAYRAELAGNQKRAAYITEWAGRL